MISAVFVNKEAEANKKFEFQLQQYFPQIKINNYLALEQGLSEVDLEENPELVFIEINELSNQIFFYLNKLIGEGLDVIIISNEKELAYEAIRFSASGFILKPIDTKELIYVVNKAIKNLRKRESNNRVHEMLNSIFSKLSFNDCIGIPTIDGLEILKPSQIIRCEGLQRCTIIYIKGNKKFISSYNIGQFIKLLEPLGFFSTHKSHLINSKEIKYVSKENFVLMSDGKNIPISRRRKTSFIEFIPRP